MAEETTVDPRTVMPEPVLRQLQSLYLDLRRDEAERSALDSIINGTRSAIADLVQEHGATVGKVQALYLPNVAKFEWRGETTSTKTSYDPGDVEAVIEALTNEGQYEMAELLKGARRTSTTTTKARLQMVGFESMERSRVAYEAHQAKEAARAAEQEIA